MRIDPDILMKLIRQHFNDDTAKPLVCTRWKDGIDIDQPTYAIKAFAEAVADMPPMLRPIDTAPQDGTWILGWAEKDSSPYRVSWGRNHGNELTWCTSFASFVPGYITHWALLPVIAS